jgi:energy-coupling factor transporter ATP-binding protein EcfA2
VDNYKSFASSGEVHFEPGFNVIVGQNNVGKTALTEALSLTLSAQPHRSQKTIQDPSDLPDLHTRVTISFVFEPAEFGRAVAREIGTMVYVPAGGPSGPDGSVRSASTANRFLTAVAGSPTIEVTYDLEAHDPSGALGPANTTTTARLVGYELATDQSSYSNRFGVDLNSGKFEHLPGDYVLNAPELNAIVNGFVRICTKRLYGFKAVRFGIDEYGIGGERNLAPDATNLVQVLDLLSRRNPSGWERFMGGVRTVLPQIKAMTFVPSERGGGMVRAKLWNVPLATERDDLAVSLSDSGTGVGQVLAILYVAFISEYPRPIVIDEPQSFLHPGAVRKLFEILKGYPQHQYVITTHSPNAVTAADPRGLFMVRKEEEESSVEQLDVSETRDQARFLREVGASLSDVFGADDVLWVEGATEEDCFPLILSRVAGRRLEGTKIVGVLSTGDLEGKRSHDVFRIYRRLSEAGGGLLPPAVGFVFDREGRSAQRRTDLDRESGGLVSFLPRRMYENYLLNTHAIADVASKIDGFGEAGGVSAGDVEGWIAAHRGESKYFERGVEEPSRNEQTWTTEVDGAEFLKDMFHELSRGLVTYDKVLHGAALTRWLCDNAPEDLQELADFIEGRLDQSASRSAGSPGPIGE